MGRLKPHLDSIRDEEMLAAVSLTPLENARRDESSGRSACASRGFILFDLYFPFEHSVNEEEIGQRQRCA